MQEAIVRELWTYPVKGCQGVAADAIHITKLGIPGDREFVLWKDGKLIDQKETPQVASLSADFDRDAGVLRFRHSEHGVYDHEIRSEGADTAILKVLPIPPACGCIHHPQHWLSEVLLVLLPCPGHPGRSSVPNTRDGR